MIITALVSVKPAIIVPAVFKVLWSLEAATVKMICVGITTSVKMIPVPAALKTIVS